MNTTASARARSMKMTRLDRLLASCFSTGATGTTRSTRRVSAFGGEDSTGFRLPATGYRLPASVRHRMEEHVDAHGITVRRELIEELRILTLTFPGIRD